MLLKKYLLGTIMVLAIVLSLFSVLSVSKAENPKLKIGIFGPWEEGFPHWDAGMWSAAQMWAEQVNTAGGWNIGGTNYDLEVVPANEYYRMPDGYVDLINAEIDRLVIQEGVHAIIGGFRTECVQVAINRIYTQGYDIPFFINGAATDELLTQTVNVSHSDYKWLWRVMPTNSTTLFYTLAGAIKEYLCADTGPLNVLFGTPSTLPNNDPNRKVNYSVVTESLTWANKIHYLLTTPPYSTLFLGNHMRLVHQARLAPSASDNDIKTVLDDMEGNQTSLLIHVFSAEVGYKLIKAWGEREPRIRCLPVGINVYDQSQFSYNLSGGAIEFETHLMTLGTRTPITPQLVTFWDNFLDWTGTHLSIRYWPVYTAIGVANGLITLETALKWLAANGYNVFLPSGKINTTSLHDLLCPTVNLPGEPEYTQLLNGKGKFTYLHDPFCNETGATWTSGFTRPHMVQWLDGYLEVVCPIDQPWSKSWCLPPWMYWLLYDSRNYDGYVGTIDVAYQANNFGGRPGNVKWDHRSDVAPAPSSGKQWPNYVGDDYVGTIDIANTAYHFGRRWPGPDVNVPTNPPPWPSTPWPPP